MGLEPKPQEWKSDFDLNQNLHKQTLKLMSYYIGQNNICYLGKIVILIFLLLDS